MEGKQIILNYLQSQFVMGITTKDKKGNLWPASVYYIVDDDLNMYFLSDTKTIHAKNISVNPNVAITVADSSQKMSEVQIGIQLIGNCIKVRGLAHVKNLIKAYKSSKFKVDAINLDAFKKAATSGIYLVTPKRIKYFNKILFPKEKYLEFEL
jgi:uncharacterized protein YhbP (UPF0306 family)